MSEPSSGPDLFNDLAQEFAERVRKGERPSPTEYAARYPELAEQIRERFPALVMEEFASAEDTTTALFAVKAAAGAPTPKQLGDYRILREVAHGGMGIVYEAVQESLGRHVALKVLSLQGRLSVTLLERFQREARAAARLHHTNIVPVFGIGEHAGVHYYVMQFIQGQSLDSVMRELRRLRTRTTAPGCHAPQGEPALAGSVAQGMLTGQFQLSEVQGGADSLKPSVPPTVAKAPATIPGALNDREGSDSTIVTQSDAQYFRSVAQVGMRVAEALAYAHQQGILHRDIKPSNLLLDVQGAVWITDFGLAKREGADELTSPGDIVGTLRYMAPERFEGQADARSDVFSLGLTLYELATLTPAFGGSERAQLIDRVLHQEPPRPRQIEPRIPRDLETIILKAIAKEPRQRYAAAGEMAEDLRRFLSDRPIHARRSSTWELAWRWCRRNPAVASLTAVVALLVVGVAVGSTVSALRLNAELRRSERAEEGEKEARQATLQALWEAYRDQAEARSLSRRRGQRFEGLKAAANATGLGGDLNLSDEQFLELRNRAIACMALPDVRVAREWDGWPADSAHLDFDAALTRYVRTDRAGGVHVYRVADNTLLSSFVSSLRNPWPRLSPDGCFLTLCAASRCEIRKLDGREPAALIPVQDCVAHDLSPDSRRIALVHPDGTLSVYDLASGRSLRQLKAGPHPVAFAAFHPSNDWLAVTHASGVQVRDLDTGDVRTDLPQAGAERLAWHPDGRKLAVVSSDQAIHLWDVAERREITALRRWKNGGLRITFNHSGDLLASYGWEHMLRLWDPRTGLEVFHTPARFTGASLRFGTDDRILAADIQDTRIRLWEIACGQECRRLIPNPACGQVPYGPFAAHPDGRALAACTLDGFGLWDVRTGKPLASVRTEPLDGLLFEPSGALLAGGASGVFRWPFQLEAEGAMRVGPPQRLSLPRTARTQFACSLDARVLATVDGAGGWIRDADHPDQLVPLRPHEDARAVAVSPDGRWVVTGSQHGTGARVWDARSGRLEKELLSQQGFVRVSFSPDGRWLATRGNGLRLWKVGSWQEGPFLGGIPAAGFAFSPTENLLATETGDGILRLLDPDTGREYAHLEEPDQVRAAWICFSPDGAQLFTVGAGSGAWIRVWDLRQLRRQLADVGLDWNLPPYPLPRDPKGGLPLRVSVDQGDLPGRLIP